MAGAFFGGSNVGNPTFYSHNAAGEGMATAPGNDLLRRFGSGDLDRLMRMLRFDFDEEDAADIPARVSRGSGASAEQETASRNAAFGRAKDQIGALSRQSLGALSGELQRRGMGGAGYEAGQIGRTLAESTNKGSEVLRDQAMEDARHAERVADTEYSGQVTQRGQDIGAKQGKRSGRLSSQQALLNYVQSQGGLY